MLVERHQKAALCDLGERLGLLTPELPGCKDKRKKTEQILAFIEEIETVVRKYSRKRELVLIDSGAGSSALSMLAYHYFDALRQRPVQVSCIDTNAVLMAKAAANARSLGLENMHFQSGDILELSPERRPDVVYALHACDTATDKAIAVGVQTQARNILTVSCCQHSFRRSMKGGQGALPLMTHQVFRDKMTYMVADTMRALLLEMVGYQTSLVEFVSSRATDKNIMLRATQTNLPPAQERLERYLALRRTYGTAPWLEDHLAGIGLLPEAIRQTEDRSEALT